MKLRFINCPLFTSFMKRYNNQPWNCLHILGVIDKMSI